jgi:hypothetical protein
MDGVDADAIGAPFAAARLAKLPVLEGSGALAGKRQTASLDQRNAIRQLCAFLRVGAGPSIVAYRSS